MATLKEIAQETGVAIPTVSRILRGQDQVSPETRERVQAAARRLKYRPNLLVRGMQTGRTQTVGVILRPIEEFQARLFSGIMDGLMADSYVPICVSGSSDHGAGGGQEQIHALIDRRVDGVIFYPYDDEVPNEFLHEVWEQNIPIVTVDRVLERTDADFVGSDDEAGADAAAEHLLALGHRHVAHLAGPQYVTTARLRRKGFETAIAASGGSCVTEVAPGFDEGYRAAMAALGGARRPTAIFCASDLMVSGVYDAAAELGLRIPEDLSVIGFSGNSLTTKLRPHVTTVQQFPYEIGKRAARLIVDRSASDGKDGTPVKIRLKTELVVRESTERPA